jgi:hypothetical protein
VKVFNGFACGPQQLCFYFRCVGHSGVIFANCSSMSYCCATSECHV